MCYQHLRSLIFYFNDLFYFRPFISHAVCNSSSSKPSLVDGAIRFFKLSAKLSNLHCGRSRGRLTKSYPVNFLNWWDHLHPAGSVQAQEHLRVCTATALWDKHTPKHNHCQWPWLCTSAGSGPRELWHCTFVSPERNTGTGIQALPLQSNSRAVQQNTKDTAAIWRHKKHSHLLPLAFSLGQVPWGVALQEELPQNCASHCQQIQGERGISSGRKVTLLKTKGMAHLNVEKCQDTLKVTEQRTSQERPIYTFLGPIFTLLWCNFS